MHGQSPPVRKVEPTDYLHDNKAELTKTISDTSFTSASCSPTPFLPSSPSPSTTTFCCSSSSLSSLSSSSSRCGSSFPLPPPCSSSWSNGVHVYSSPSPCRPSPSLACEVRESSRTWCAPPEVRSPPLPTSSWLAGESEEEKEESRRSEEVGEQPAWGERSRTSTCPTVMNGSGSSTRCSTKWNTIPPVVPRTPTPSLPRRRSSSSGFVIFSSSSFSSLPLRLRRRRKRQLQRLEEEKKNEAWLEMNQSEYRFCHSPIGNDCMTSSLIDKMMMMTATGSGDGFSTDNNYMNRNNHNHEEDNFCSRRDASPSPFPFRLQVDLLEEVQARMREDWLEEIKLQEHKKLCREWQEWWNQKWRARKYFIWRRRRSTSTRSSSTMMVGMTRRAAKTMLAAAGGGGSKVRGYRCFGGKKLGSSEPCREHALSTIPMRIPLHSTTTTATSSSSFSVFPEYEDSNRTSLHVEKESMEKAESKEEEKRKKENSLFCTRSHPSRTWLPFALFLPLRKVSSFFLSFFYYCFQYSFFLFRYFLLTLLFSRGIEEEEDGEEDSHYEKAPLEIVRLVMSFGRE